MKLSSRSARHDTRLELSMTSMIDVVFLLLIFFMTTASFVKTEREYDPAIAVEEQSSQSEASDLEPAIVEVVRSGDRFVYRLGAREMTSVDELVGVLGAFNNKLDGAFVRASDDSPFAMAASAIGACKSASFPSVSYVPLAEQ